MNCTVSNKHVFASRVGISVDMSSIYFNRLKFCNALHLNEWTGQQPSFQALSSRSRGWEEERPWEQGWKGSCLGSQYVRVFGNPRVKGRWHAPSGQRPVIPRDKNKFFKVYRLDDLIVLHGFLLGRRGAWSKGGEGGGAITICFYLWWGNYGFKQCSLVLCLTCL